MCGISGLWSNFGNRDEHQISIKKMNNALHHRGPDGVGVWNDSEEMFFLAHRRLSILDLSHLGSQPMISNDGRYVISFNGELSSNKKSEIHNCDGFWRIFK